MELSTAVLSAGWGNARFDALEIGAAFRLRTPVGYVGGLYYKTGPESYGLRRGEAIWPWLNEGDGIVEAQDPQDATKHPEHRPDHYEMEEKPDIHNVFPNGRFA